MESKDGDGDITIRDRTRRPINNTNNFSCQDQHRPQKESIPNEVRIIAVAPNVARDQFMEVEGSRDDLESTVCLQKNSTQVETKTRTFPEFQIANELKPPPKQSQIEQKQQEETPQLSADPSSIFPTVAKRQVPIPPSFSNSTSNHHPQQALPRQQQDQPMGATTRIPPTNADNGKNTESATPCLDRNQKAQKDLRRKNRRRLYRLLNKPGAQPSFLRVIGERNTIKKEPKTGLKNTNDKNIIALLDDESDDDFLLEPPKVVIDVDEYLGLKKKRKFSEVMLSASLIPTNTTSSFVSVTNRNSNGILPTFASSIGSSAKGTLSDNGWFEGSRPMAMVPDDAMYLTENQQLIRKNMELFSATAIDLKGNSYRKSPVVVGRVGFRCMHCAKAFRNGAISKMPPASVSFPKNFTALYNLAIQKQQMHINLCRHVPSEMKEGGKSRKRRMTTVPALAYWQISCRRLGIVELQNNSGLRFGRDPKLEPLPFNTIRIEVEQEQPNLIPRNTKSAIVERRAPATVLSASNVGMMGTATSSAAIVSNESSIDLPRAVANVLKQARGESDDLTNQLISKDDSAALSDFMCLTIKQATFCHAVKEDFATRGKKTRLMRLGYTGFCCRHCKLNYYTNGTKKIDARVFQNSCRSFSSSRDNIGSAMSNSFVLHLMKCAYTPLNIKETLRSLKRVHSKQMHRLPYGSQSGVFLKIWQRIRAADKPIEDRVGRGVASIRSRALTQNEEDEEYRPDIIDSSVGMNHQLRSPNRTRASTGRLTRSDVDYNESRDVLKEAEENWEPSQNDNLIQREDRTLISDFVFLCMRQLKVSIPTGADFRLGRAKRIAGVCCIHCLGKQSTSHSVSSGRSFPSTPDNIASILNATIYKHLMSCPNVPTILKRTIDALRKSHNKQCSSLPYGSQQRYFEKVFARLRNVPLDGVLANTRKCSTLQADSIYFSTLQKCAFVRTKSSRSIYWQCSKCRMVPYDYRAPGSIFFHRPPIDEMEKHRSTCQNDSVDWSAIHSSLKTLGVKYGGATSLVSRESFSNLIRSVVGSEAEVFDTYMTRIGTLSQATVSSSDRGIWRRLPLQVEFDSVQESFSVLRKDLDLPPASLNDCPDFLEFLRLVSCTFQIPPVRSSNVKDEESPSSSTTILSDQQKKAKFDVLPGSIEIERRNNASKEPIVIDRLFPSAAKSTNGSKKETTVVNQELTWDQGINVMDNIEAGQFDDA